MVADERGAKKSKVEEASDHIDQQLLASIENLQELQDQLDKVLVYSPLFYFDKLIKFSSSIVCVFWMYVNDPSLMPLILVYVFFYY